MRGEQPLLHSPDWMLPPCPGWGILSPPGSCTVDSASVEGILDPSPAPEAGLSAMGRLHFPAIPEKSENPLALTAATTGLSASPACPRAGNREPGAGSCELEAGLWWPEQPAQPREPGAPGPSCAPSLARRTGLQPAPPCHARPSQPPEGPEPAAEAARRRPDVADPGRSLYCPRALCGLLLPAVHRLDSGLAERPAGSGLLMPLSPFS